MRCITTGLGGVHRGAERSMDVSVDLTELGRTPVAVVCAGAKTVLDIPRTLEVLETQVPPSSPHGPCGVPRVWFGPVACSPPTLHEGRVGLSTAFAEHRSRACVLCGSHDL